MKKIFVLLALLSFSVLFAVDLPRSISAKCGNVELRFDARKFWNINSIIYKGEHMTTDFTGSHYGMTYTVPGLKGFIGSGHTETGVSEVVKSLRFVIDGKETVPAEKLPEGKTLHMEKHSIIGNFDVIYTLIVKDDVIKEITRIKVLKTTTLSVIYCFMHPWVTDFDPFYAFGGKEPEIRQNMDSKDRWYMGHKNYPVIALFNSKTGSAVASEVWFNTPNDPSFHTGRILRDCSVYRKDYFVPFCNTTLVKGFKAEVAAETRFFKTTSDNFIKDAEKVFPPVK